MKLGQVGVGSNNAENHSSSLLEVIHYCTQSIIKSWQLTLNEVGVISGHYWPKFTWKVGKKWNYVKLKLALTLLKFTHPAFRKSYLIIIGPNPHAKLTKCEINALIQSLGSHIWSLLGPIYMKSWLNLGSKVVVSSNISRTRHLAFRKSYLVTICSNSYEKFTKSEIWSTWNRFKHCLESLI